MHSKLLLLALAIGAGLLLLFSLTNTKPEAAEPNRLSDAATRAPQAEGAALEEVDSRDPAEPAGTSRQAIAAAEGQGADAPSSEALSSEDPSSAATGRWIVLDPDGRELPEASGRLLLAAPSGEERPVEVRDGRFTLVGLPEGPIRIVSAAVLRPDGERPLAVEPPMFELSPGVSVLLTGRVLPASFLRVVDADTGLAVADVGVLPRSAASGTGHPGPHFPASFVLRNEPSPVRLPAARGIRPYWVTARGYSWSHLLVDHDRGGERLVELQRAGRLIVNVQGDRESYSESALKAELRVYASGADDPIAVSDLGSSQGFSGIPVGIYDVRAELGALGSDPRVLGSTRAELVAGQDCIVVLDLLGDVRPPSAGQVTGEIIVPAANRSLDLRPSQRIQPAEGAAVRARDTVRIRAPHGPEYRYRDSLPLEEAAMDGRYAAGGGAELFRWRAKLSAGRYLFVVEPVQHGVVLEVPAEPESSLRIELPDLYPVTLRVVDASSGEALPGASIRWARAFTTPEVDGWVELDLEPGFEAATVHLTEGAFTFAGSAPGCADATVEAYAGPGSNVFTLELSPELSREILLLKGETAIPWGPGMTCTFRSVDSDEPRPCERFETGRMRATFERAGVYEFRVEGLEGAGDLEPTVVDVAAGDEPIVIQLGT